MSPKEKSHILFGSLHGSRREMMVLTPFLFDLLMEGKNFVAAARIVNDVPEYVLNTFVEVPAVRQKFKS